jgi:hypothetical protein
LADGVPRSEVQLLRQLYFNRTGILFLLMALASIGMLAASSKTSGVAGQLWLALGSATLATTGYSFVQVLLTTRQFNDFLADAIKSDIRSAMTAASAESMEQFRALQTQYVPVATYPALDATNPGFNNDLNASNRGVGSLYSPWHDCALRTGQAFPVAPRAPGDQDHCRRPGQAGCG